MAATLGTTPTSAHSRFTTRAPCRCLQISAQRLPPAQTTPTEVQPDTTHSRRTNTCTSRARLRCGFFDNLSRMRTPSHSYLLFSFPPTPAPSSSRNRICVTSYPYHHPLSPSASLSPSPSPCVPQPQPTDSTHLAEHLCQVSAAKAAASLQCGRPDQPRETLHRLSALVLGQAR